MDVGEWPADSLVATQLASFRLATLRAFNVIHGGENARDPPLKRFGRRGGNVGYSNALVALCGTPVRPLPDSNLGSACVVALRGAGTARRRRGRGAWASGGGGGGDAALDELRAFDGGWDAPRDEEFFSGFGLGGYAKGSFRRGFSRRFPRPAGLAATLQATRVHALAFLCTVDPAALRFIEAEAGIVVKGDVKGDDSNPSGDDSNPAKTVRKRFEFDGSGPFPASPASLVNACVASLALADSDRFKSFADASLVASSLAKIAGAVGRSRWSGPAHWRVAAELSREPPSSGATRTRRRS